MHIHHAFRPTLLLATFALATFVACDPADDSGPTPDEEALVEDDESDAPAVVDAELALPERDAPPVPEDLDPQGLDFTAEIDPKGYITKGWVSEEGPALTCGTGQIMSGVGCSGSYCDNVGLECHNYGGTLGESSWSAWFSEEAPNNFYQCPGTGYITGITCSGGNCDNVSVECSTTNLARYSCDWTLDWYSEEQGWYLTYGTEAIAGIWCSGSNCDRKRYLVCETV